MSRQKRDFSRREREMVDIVYALGHATAQEIRRAMRRPPTDAAVRATLRILVEKGHLRIVQNGPRFDYWPTVPGDVARRSELKHLLRTFFSGSPESALATLLDITRDDLDDQTRKRLKRLIDETAKEGR